MELEHLRIIVLGAASFFLAGNVYFLKRLVDKIDTCEKNSNIQIVHSAENKLKFSTIEKDLKDLELKNEKNFSKLGDKIRSVQVSINELKKIEKDVAVLQTIVNLPDKFGS